MKAKDTVLKANELIRLKEEQRETNTDIEASLTKQADVSFTAGYNQSLSDHEWDDNYYEGKREGIKEMIEWLQHYLDTPEIKGSAADKIINQHLYYKLAKWGIEK